MKGRVNGKGEGSGCRKVERGELFGGKVCGGGKMIEFRRMRGI